MPPRGPGESQWGPRQTQWPHRTPFAAFEVFRDHNLTIKKNVVFWGREHYLDPGGPGPARDRPGTGALWGPRGSLGAPEGPRRCP